MSANHLLRLKISVMARNAAQEFYIFYFFVPVVQLKSDKFSPKGSVNEICYNLSSMKWKIGSIYWEN